MKSYTSGPSSLAGVFKEENFTLNLVEEFDVPRAENVKF